MKWTGKAPIAVLAALGVGLGACTYRTGYEENPITRSFAWFSYLNADDIRTQCAGGGPDRYRIVYNAVWQEQVRTYDFTVRGEGSDFVVQVRGSADFSNPIPLDDLLKPWRGETRRGRIGRDELSAVQAALRESGFYEPVPQGLRVQSWGFFWVAAACEDGRFRFNAWAYPSERFEKVVLATPLRAVDGTGIPFNPPRETWEPDREEDKDIDRYQLVVEGDGFGGNLKLF